MSSDRRSVWGWALYDWANSAFATSVMAGFFPVFFKQYWSHGADVNLSTAQLGLGNSLASLVVALMAPILGAIADKGSAKKKFLIFFGYLGVISTAALFFVGQGQWAWAIFIFAAGIIGFSGANVFYDALLPSVAGEDKVDSVSCLGFSMGYLGGGLLLALNVFMTLKPAFFGLADAAEAVRWSFLSVALWWGSFTLFTIFWVKEEKVADNRPLAAHVRSGIEQFVSTFKKIRHLKAILLFLVAYWFYIDGVDTIIRMAVDYGMTLGFDSTNLIIALMMVQFIGFPAALLFGWMGSRWSVRGSIFIALGVYIFITIMGVNMTTVTEFYVLAGVVGLVQGGIQALSRSYYSRLIPTDQAGEFYGFYNMLGKFAAILGPALMGLVGLVAKRLLLPDAPTQAQILAVGQEAARWAIGSVLILFIIGGVLFYLVDEKKARQDLEAYTRS